MVLLSLPRTVEGVGAVILSKSSASCLAGLIFTWIFFMARPRKREGWVKRSWLKKMVTLKKWGVPEKEKPELDRKRCLALKSCRSGNSQCTLLSVPGQQYCSNHLHKQPHGTVQPEHGEKEKEKEKEEEEQPSPTISKYWLSQNLPPAVPSAHGCFSRTSCTSGVRAGHMQCFAQPSLEIPLPTTQNCWNGMCIARKTLKVHWSMAARAFQSLGVHQVHVGQYGCKIPLQVFKQDFAALLDQPMADIHP